MGCRCGVCTAAAREYRRAYVAKNRESVNALKRSLWIKNRSAESEKRKLKWERDKDAINAARRLRYKNDPAYRQKILSDAAKTPKIGAAAKTKKWRKENPDKYRALVFARRGREKNALGFATAEQIWWRKHFYSNKCWMCGSTATTIDHVIPLSKGGTNWPANLRPACLPCNTRKQAKILWRRTAK